MLYVCYSTRYFVFHLCAFKIVTAPSKESLFAAEASEKNFRATADLTVKTSIVWLSWLLAMEAEYIEPLQLVKYTPGQYYRQLLNSEVHFCQWCAAVCQTRKSSYRVLSTYFIIFQQPELKREPPWTLPLFETLEGNDPIVLQSRGLQKGGKLWKGVQGVSRCPAATQHFTVLFRSWDSFDGSGPIWTPTRSRTGRLWQIEGGYLGFLSLLPFLTSCSLCTILGL